MDPSTDTPLSDIVVVLDQPKDVVNIAGVIRVMMNMGLSRLRLVQPDNFHASRIEGIAHRSRPIIDTTQVFDDLAEALADAVYVVGATARERAAHTNARRPREIAAVVVDRASTGVVALLFGREDRGLSNEGLDLCHELIVIPTNERFSSLNLAQACLVVCYELFLAAGDRTGRAMGRGKKARITEPATRDDLEEMYRVLENGLGRIGFFKGSRRPAAVLRTLRTLLGRTELSLREAKLLRAIGFAIDQHADRPRDDDETS